MKKLSTLLILIILSTAVFAAWNYEHPQVDFDEGWNLFYSFYNPAQLEGQALDQTNIKAIYAFIPTTQEYARVFPDPETKKLGLINDDELIQTAFWVYTDKGALTEFWLEDAPVPLEERPMYKGWNFVGITQDMTELNIKHIKGTCTLEKIYFYVNEYQRWEKFTEENEIDKSTEGMGFVVKVADDCRMGRVSATGLTPPTIPSNGDTELGSFEQISIRDEREECTSDGTLCLKSTRMEYRDSTGQVVWVILTDITKGTENQMKEYYATEMGGVLETIFVGSNKLYRLEAHELFWFIDSDQHDLIATQEGIAIGEPDGGERMSYGTATGDNAVTAYWLSKHPSVETD